MEFPPSGRSSSTASKTKPPSSNPGRTLFICIALALLTLAVYGQVIGHGFISFDDDDYIMKNPVVQRGLTIDGLIWAFSSPHVYNWHPLTWLSHMLDVRLFGLNAGGHHLMGLLFHIANTLLLFAIFGRMTGAPWRSAAVAALFALHPLHVESVAWAAERKDVLSTLFWMLTLWLYFRYVKHPGVRRYWLLCLCYAAGLLAKQMAVTLPFVLLLLDYWPLGRFSPQSAVLPAASIPHPVSISEGKTGKHGKGPISNGDRMVPHPPAAADGGKEENLPRRIDWSCIGPLIREKLPLFALAAGASVLIYLVQAQTGIVKSAVEYPLSARLGNALVSYIAYLIKALFPLHLAVFYPHPGTALPLWQAISALLLIVAITALAVRSQKPYLAVGWLWYLGTLVPVIGLVQVGIQGMADRYTYVPLIGVFIMTAWGIPDLAAGWRSRQAALIGIAAAGLAALAILTWFQAGTWRNNIALYSHATKVTAGNDWAEYNLGLSLLKDEERDEEALSHFREAIRLRPGYADAYLNIGAIQAKRGHLDDAAANFSRALELKPAHPEALRNLSVALLQLGRLDEAALRIEAFRQIRPDDPEVLFLAGLLQAKRGNPSEAETAYGQAIRLKPDYAEAHNHLGILLARQGRIEAAIGHFREALRIRPDYREANRNLETALGERQGGR